MMVWISPSRAEDWLSRDISISCPERCGRPVLPSHNHAQGHLGEGSAERVGIHVTNLFASFEWSAVTNDLHGVAASLPQVASNLAQLHEPAASITNSLNSFTQLSAHAGSITNYLGRLTEALSADSTNWANWIAFAATVLSVIATAAALWAAHESRRAVKGQVLLQLLNEYRSEAIYGAFLYVHSLRSEWKIPAGTADSTKLARRWVEDHDLRKAKAAGLADTKLKQIREENLHRRAATQFLAKMGYAIQAKYLSWDEFFGVVPEAGRHLIVLYPIEKELIDYWREREATAQTDWVKIPEGYDLPAWDRAAPKCELKFLADEYEKWFKRNKEKLELPKFEWVFKRAEGKRSKQDGDKLKK